MVAFPYAASLPGLLPGRVTRNLTDSREEIDVVIAWAIAGGTGTEGMRYRSQLMAHDLRMSFQGSSESITSLACRHSVARPEVYLGIGFLSGSGAHANYAPAR